MEMHEHTWQAQPSAVEECACGAMRVIESTATVARRNKATGIFKRRYNDAHAGRVCRECSHPLSAHRNDYDCACGCEAFVPLRADLTPVEEVAFEAIFVAPPNARRVN